ncbi:exported protein [Staphylococcus epidermidis]|nr:exported protein [Staphylococcus epidermidis]
MNKKIILIFIILISIVLIIGGVYLKKKNDKQKEKEQQYYDEQKERITLYMKYNVKKYKDVTFTNVEENPLDGYDISGYVNHNKKPILPRI